MRTITWAGLILGGIFTHVYAMRNANWSRLDLDIYQDNQTGQKIFQGRITKIIDGDTIVLGDAIKIRMYGIDAPESKQLCTDSHGNEYTCGRLATEHLQQIIGTGVVNCRLHGHDTYGRFLMTCFTMDGRDIHAQMVRDGYAVVSTYNPEIYRADEQYAIEHKLGIHNGTFWHPHCWRHRKKKNWTVPGLCDNNAAH